MKLKDIIKKLNFFSLFITIILIGGFSFTITYITIKDQLRNDINFVKKTYINNQKSLMKHQVNNIINTIEALRSSTFDDMKKRLKNRTEMIDYIFNYTTSYKNIVKIFDTHDKYIHFTLSDLNATPIYTTLKDYNRTKRMKLIKKMLKNSQNNIYFVHKTPKGIKITYQHIFKNYLLTTCFYQKEVEEIVKNKIIKIIYFLRFGANNNGYISIAKILNYKGGKHFAKVIALPVNPQMVGKLLDDDKKDAKGKEYRKEYLKIANTTKEGFVSYWFYKYSQNVVRPKISYVKLYKPWDWLIFTSVFIDDINSVIKHKIDEYEKELKKLLFIYIISLIVVVIIGILITRFENKIFDQIINEYEKEINKQNKYLEDLNKRLHTEVRQKTKRLIDSLLTDRITNLPNREKLIHDLKDNYLAIINIDDFKEINDFYGVEEGDKLIKNVARFLNEIYPTYKLSGDEYAIIADSPAKLRKISAEIIEKLKNKTFRVGNEDIKINVSVGIGKTLAQADTALRYSKNSKKQIIVYNKKLPVLKEFENNLKWKKIINHAIENDSIIPYVQGIVDNETKNIIKYECLMRLEHNGKVYTPYFFLEIAKKTYQYEIIQKILIEKCFKKFSTLPYSFSVNISTSDLKSSKFLEFLFKKIDEYNIAEKLTIELLEDEELIQNKSIIKIVHKLKEKGVSIAIDDFGSGYSNFVYLIKNLPIDILKIDGSLVKDILTDEKLYKLLKKIVEIANTFGYKTIAEFVENEEIYIKVKELNINASQGYYFSKPFDIKELK